MKRLISALALVIIGISGTVFVADGRSDDYEPVMAEFVHAVDNVKREFPAIQDASISVAPLDPHVYAETGKNGITVNSIFASNKATLERYVQIDVATGFHPLLGHCTGTQFLAYHESAHLVDFSENTIAHNMLYARFGDGRLLSGILSGYSFYRVSNTDIPWLIGTINMTEALAEAFAAAHCGSANWAEQALNQMLTN